jgi:3-oxoacyl-[acyl-carrier-protein] synthase II
MLSVERHYERLALGNDDLTEDEFFAKKYWTTGRLLAAAFGIGGPCLTVVTACAAGGGALGHAADLVRSGLAEVVLCGGGDVFALSTLAGFDALKATCNGMCSPFSENIGLNLGEGAAMFVLESDEHVARRGGEVLAEILGYGMSNDAFHPTSPDPTTRGQCAAMERALRDAHLTADAVDYVNAHGTGTRANDPIESKAIARLLGERVAGVPTSSTKSIIGHCLGGAGALEAASVILAARSGIMPPTAGWTAPREGCALPDYVPQAGRPWKGRIALSNSFGFAGHNTCLVIDTCPVCAKEPPPRLESVPRRAVITGLGVVSALGLGAAALRGEKSGVAIGSRFSSPQARQPVGLVPPIEGRKVDRRLDLRDMDLCSAYGTIAAKLALDSSARMPRAAQLAEIGLVLGLATGPSQAESQHIRAVLGSGLLLKTLGAFPYVVPNAVAGCMARALEIKGHHSVVTAGEGSGLLALVLAAQAVEHGHSQMLLAGSSDELSERLLLDSCAVGLWGPSTDVVPGEGAAALLLEEGTSAVARGATVKAHLLGYGLAVSGTATKESFEDAYARALDTALSRALVTPSEVAGFSGAGRGSDIDDIERGAVHRVFGNKMVPITTVADRTGFAESTLPLLNLAYLLEQSFEGAVLVVGFISSDGIASAVVVRAGEARSDIEVADE